MRSTTLLLLLAVLALGIRPSMAWALDGPGGVDDAGEDHEPGQPRTEEETRPTLRNPQGAIVVQGIGGFAGGNGGFSVLLGAGLGYAVWTGVVPGARATVLLGDVLGAETVGTLTLSLPFEGSLTPFLLGELGYRWESALEGLLYGVGGGIYLGDPRGPYALQVGAVYRIWRFGAGSENVRRAFWPVLSISVGF